MAYYSTKIKEEELKNKVAEDWFGCYDTTQIIGNIDFCVAVPQTIDSPDLFERENLLWAESKAGDKQDIYDSFVQLILTIGKARSYDQHIAPAFIGAFDAEKIAFISYNSIMEVFYQNDFNWNVTPSDHTSREFKLLSDKVCKALQEDALIYNYQSDAKELKHFIRHNFVVGKTKTTKLRITKNNFISIFQKWRSAVMPTIAYNYGGSKNSASEVDFYLADILAENNLTLAEKLNVILKTDHYEIQMGIDIDGAINFGSVHFNDKQKAHHDFWNRYRRPPKKEYWQYISERRDLLVPQNIRERKGSYFTPQCWVELSQQYIERELGENWQDEYVIWDCAAGTGNLLNGLNNKYNIWASTLDKADVDVMKENIKYGANLLESHVFQFDFLNDDFDKIPEPLFRIIQNEEERKKLIIYINPPYAEAGDIKQVSGTGKNKTNVAVANVIYKKYQKLMGIAGRELYAQFLTRIYQEIGGCIIAQFSTLKALQTPNFFEFRSFFLASIGKSFIVPANTFDNVKGQFPIGFFIWHTDKKERFSGTVSDVYDSHGEQMGSKSILCYDDMKGNIGKWVSTFKDEHSDHIGFMSNGRNDFQNQKLVYFMNEKSQMPTPRGWWITGKNLIPMAIFVAVRKCIDANWLNDRDQFLYPATDKWLDDTEFQNDCLIYMLLSNSNTIKSSVSTNHWIPYSEKDVDAKEKFESHFMVEYLSGKKRPLIIGTEGNLFSSSTTNTEPLILSKEAQAVYDSGKKLWTYYHTQKDAMPNASLYDIKLYFQGQNENGKMNTESQDVKYSELNTELKMNLKTLSFKIRPKVYEFEFLKK